MKKFNFRSFLTLLAVAIFSTVSLNAQSVYVTERGGGGKLTQIMPDGSRVPIANIPNADGITMADANTVIVSEWSATNGKVHSINLSTKQTTELAKLSNRCQGMDFDHKKNLLIVNEFSKKIQTIDFVTKALGDLVTGLDRPIDVFSDSDNSVVITEYIKNQLVRYDYTTRKTTVVASGFNKPTDIFREESGNLLIAENGGTISRVNIQTWARTVVSSKNPGTGGFAPHGIAKFDKDNVLVTDYTQGRIFKLNLATGNYTPYATGLNQPIFIVHTSAVELPAKFKVRAFSINQGAGTQVPYWFGFSTGNTQGKILKETDLVSGSNIWMQLEKVDLGNNQVAFKVTNAPTPNSYLTAKDDKTVHLLPATGGQVPDGAKFISGRALTAVSGAQDYRSFESVKFPGSYLRHTSFIMYIHPSDNSELFKQDASWRIVE